MAEEALEIETPLIKGRKNMMANPFEKDSEVLAHQLEGIMFHSDMVLLYTLLGDKKMCRKHYRQLFEELKTHELTAKNMVMRYGHIIEPLPTERIEVYNSFTAPTTPEEVAELKRMSMKKWLEWEEETEELYTEMLMLQPHVEIWTELLKDVKTEIKEIHCLMKKEGYVK